MKEIRMIDVIQGVLEQTAGLPSGLEVAALAESLYRGISEHLGIYEDVYEQLTERLEPHVNRNPHDDRRTFPASVVDSFNMLMDHWESTGMPEIVTPVDPTYEELEAPVREKILVRLLENERAQNPLKAKELADAVWLDIKGQLPESARVHDELFELARPYMYGPENNYEGPFDRSVQNIYSDLFEKWKEGRPQ
jgi:hypothetical protein